MNSIADKINNLNLPSQVKLKMLYDVFIILLSKIEELFNDRFSTTIINQIKKNIENREYEQAVVLTKECISEDEWNTKVIPELEKIIDSYEQEVLQKISS